jgi:hypothetical protein
MSGGEKNAVPDEARQIVKFEFTPLTLELVEKHADTLDALHRLARKTPTLDGKPFFVPSAAHLRKRLSRKNSGRTFFALTAMANGKPVGITSGRMVGRRGYSGHIFLLEEHQCKGMGWALFKEKIRRLVALGATTVTIRPITETDKRMAKLYVHEGGQRFEQIEDKARPKSPRYVMRL